MVPAQSNVLMPQAKFHIADKEKNPYPNRSNLDGNLQRDKRDTQELTNLLQGRGKGPNDMPYLFRIRMDKFPDGWMPVVNDTVFVTQAPNSPELRGWYTIWQEPRPTTGMLPTLILYLHKEVL